VLGSGRSTPAALALAAARPDRVEAVIVFNGFARFVRADDHPIGIPAELVARFRDVVLDTSRETMPTALDDVRLHAPSFADDERFRSWWRRAGQQGASPATSSTHFALLFDADVRHVLPHITQPTLVVQRRDNRYVRAAHGVDLAARIANATYVELDGADQLLAADPGPVVDAIAAFLARRPPPPSR
jgi:pimeloyl-ACP methyl ester carboxylesterase